MFKIFYWIMGFLKKVINGFFIFYLDILDLRWKFKRDIDLKYVFFLFIFNLII